VVEDIPIAFVFPGQGSQYVGMGQQLYDTFEEAKEVFDTADRVLGFSIRDLCFKGPEAELNLTENTQPAILAVSIAALRVLQVHCNIRPRWLAGHSLGEYSALVCAGAFEFTDAIRLVAARGQYMLEAVPPGTGAMAAILGLDDDVVRAVCVEAAGSDVVEAVNFNSPGQVVVAGNKMAVERATVLAKDKGAKRAVILPVSVPSHCQLMKPAADKLAVELKKIEVKQPAISVVNNVDVKIESDPDAIRDALVRQLYQPVRWVEVIQVMAEKSITKIIECGPGKVLLGLNKRIDKSLSHAAITDKDSLSQILQD